MEQSPQDHDSIRKLMAIKRHESPPFGFFDQFHARVMDRIADQIERSKLAWWDRGLLLFDSKPVLAGAYAVTVAGLFVCGLGFSRMIQTETAELELGGNSMVLTPPIQPAGFSASRFGAPVWSVDPGTVAMAAGTPGQARIMPDPSPGGPPAFLFSPSELTTQPVSDGLGAR